MSEPLLHATDDVWLEQHGKPSSHDPQSLSGPKETRRIPLRSSKILPNMRTPPSDLFQLSQPKRLVPNSPTYEHPPPPSTSLSLHAPRLSIPFCVPSNAPALRPIGYERRRLDESCNYEIQKGSGSPVKPIPTLAPPPPGIPLTCSKSYLQGHTAAAGIPRFLHILDTNKRKNPHAPSLVSKFNPLRDYVPPCAWANKGLLLTSARFRTPLSLLPLRSRSDCDWATRDGRRTKENYLKKYFLHCHGCRRDTLEKKLLVMNYFVRQLHHILYNPFTRMGSFDDDHDDLDAMEIDDDLLNSPLLQDCDDFDDFDDRTDRGDVLLPGGPGIEMSNLSLF